MRTLLCLCLLLTTVVHAGEVIASGTLAITPLEDSSDINITYGNVRDTLVTGSSPANSSTYLYRIKTLGSSTASLKTSAPAPVVPGTTVVVSASPTANQTTSLLYTPKPDEFTLFPTSSLRSTPACLVCVVEVLNPAGTAVLATVDLNIDIQGVTDTRAGGYYNGVSSSDLTQPDPITVAAGETKVLTYQQIAAMCNWTDKERDGAWGWYPGTFPSANANIANPSGSAWPSGGADSVLLTYDGTLTLLIPSNQPPGISDLFRFTFLYDPDGPNGSPSVARTNIVWFRVNVVSGGSGSGGSSGGGGGGGCGAGALGGMILLGSLFALRRRRPGLG